MISNTHKKQADALMILFDTDKNGIENEIGNGNESDKAKEEFTSLVNRAVSALRSGQLPKMIAELAQVYLQLEEFYMGESTSKVQTALFLDVVYTSTSSSSSFKKRWRGGNTSTSYAMNCC